MNALDALVTTMPAAPGAKAPRGDSSGFGQALATLLPAASSDAGSGEPAIDPASDREPEPASNIDDEEKDAAATLASLLPGLALKPRPDTVKLADAAKPASISVETRVVVATPASALNVAVSTAPATTPAVAVRAALPAFVADVDFVTDIDTLMTAQADAIVTPMLPSSRLREESAVARPVRAMPITTAAIESARSPAIASAIAADTEMTAQTTDPDAPLPNMPASDRHAETTTAHTPASVRNGAADNTRAPVVSTQIALEKADETLVPVSMRRASASTDAPSPTTGGGWISLGTATARAEAGMPIPLATQPDREAWQQAIARHVSLIAQGELGEARLQIEGRELGPIEVSVKIDGDRVDVRFAIQHPITAALVQDALPRLERMLEHQGLALGHASVDQGQSQQRDERSASAAPRFGGAQANARGDSAVIGARDTPVTRSHNRLLDDFA
jgi:flagellar hook-length control protein FliK